MIYEVETEMVVGWFEEELWVVQDFWGTVLVRREFVLWIDRNCVDCEAMCGSLCWIGYEVLECDICEPPFPSMSSNCVMCIRVSFSRRISCFEIIVAITISAWGPILIKGKQFWEWTRSNGGIPKEFYKGVSCMKKDFTARGSKNY